MVETVLGMTDLQIKLVTAAGQLALAGMVAYVAWQQWRTARNKLKADLFDRRLALMKALEALGEKTYLENLTDADLAALPALAKEFGYLFGKSVSEKARLLSDALRARHQIKAAIVEKRDLLRTQWDATAFMSALPKNRINNELQLLEKRIAVTEEEIRSREVELIGVTSALSGYLVDLQMAASEALTLKH
ncbi:hypothetical protein [Stenotrophomonas muris]|uniref:hypothetical protein n=1 Tax=Stenotrophomonas muris TaxID=2963283 RepID=UPI003F81E581